MIVLLFGLLLLSPHPVAQTTPSPPPACLDFTSQAEAQSFYEAQGGPASDPHGLDPNRDGRACSDESVRASTTPSVTQTETPGVAGATTPTNGALPSGSSRGPWGWVGLALAVGGLGVAGYSIWRRRRRSLDAPPAQEVPRLDDIGW